MPEKIAGGRRTKNAQGWAANLMAATKTGVFAADVGSWTAGDSVQDATATALKWARDANALVCSAVMPEGQDGVKGAELGGKYYEENAAVVEMQVAKGGFV